MASGREVVRDTRRAGSREEEPLRGGKAASALALMPPSVPGGGVCEMVFNSRRVSRRRKRSRKRGRRRRG